MLVRIHDETASLIKAVSAYARIVARRLDFKNNGFLRLLFEYAEGGGRFAFAAKFGQNGKMFEIYERVRFPTQHNAYETVLVRDKIEVISRVLHDARLLRIVPSFHHRKSLFVKSFGGGIIFLILFG